MRKVTFTTIVTASLLFLMSLLLATQVFAGVGISPASIENDKLRPGTTFEKEIVFSRSDVDTQVQVTVEPDLGDANSWVTVQPGTVFNVEKGVQRVPIKIIFTVPSDAKLEPIKGSIRIKVSDNTDNAGTVDVIKGAKVDVSLTTTNAQFVDFLVRSIVVSDVDKQGVGTVTAKVENTGNTVAAPSKVDLAFLDFAEKEVTKVSASGFSSIAPGEIKDLKLNFTLSGVPVGEYFVDATVYSDARVLRQERLVVNVLGSVSDVAVSDGSFANGQFLRFLEENKLLALLLVVFIAVSVTALFVFLFRNSEDREMKQKQPTA